MSKDIVHLHRKDLENLKQYREKYITLTGKLRTELYLIETIENQGGKLLPTSKSVREGLEKILDEVEKPNCTPEGCKVSSIEAPPICTSVFGWKEKKIFEDDEPHGLAETVKDPKLEEAENRIREEMMKSGK